MFYIKNRFNNINHEINSFYFLIFLKYIKHVKKHQMFKLFFKSQIFNNLIILHPSYSVLNQYFEYRPLFFTVLRKSNIKGFFIYKNLFRQSGYNFDFSKNKNILIGYNFFTINSTYNKYLILEKIFSDKEYNKIGKVKSFSVNQPAKLDTELTLFFMYNLYFNNIVELYKINIYLFLNNIINL
jgi:hypothetical protein